MAASRAGASRRGGAGGRARDAGGHGAASARTRTGRYSHRACGVWRGWSCNQSQTRMESNRVKSNQWGPRPQMPEEYGGGGADVLMAAVHWEEQA